MAGTAFRLAVTSVQYDVGANATRFIASRTLWKSRCRALATGESKAGCCSPTYRRPIIITRWNARGYASARKLIPLNLIAQRADRYAEYVGSVGPISASPSQCFANELAFDGLNSAADKISNRLKFRWREFRAKRNFPCR